MLPVSSRIRGTTTFLPQSPPYSQLDASRRLCAQLIYGSCERKGALLSARRFRCKDFPLLQHESSRLRIGSKKQSRNNRPFYADVRRDSEAVKQALLSRHPLFKGLGRICQTDDVARAVVFLASDEAIMITGVTLPVDGGRSAYDAP